MDFVATQCSDYIRGTYWWLLREYPESAPVLQEKLRELYREAKAREDAKAKAAQRYL